MSLHESRDFRLCLFFYKILAFSNINLVAWHLISHDFENSIDTAKVYLVPWNMVKSLLVLCLRGLNKRLPESSSSALHLLLVERYWTLIAVRPISATYCTWWRMTGSDEQLFHHQHGAVDDSMSFLETIVTQYVISILISSP